MFNSVGDPASYFTGSLLKGGITKLSRPGSSKTRVLASISIKLGFKNTELG